MIETTAAWRSPCGIPLNDTGEKLAYIVDILSSVTGSGVGDPVMTDFEGRTFEFMGKVGSFYNVISDKEHQVLWTVISLCYIRSPHLGMQ